MRKATETEAVGILLLALFEGTVSDGPWVGHNGGCAECYSLNPVESTHILALAEYGVPLNH